MNAIYVCHFNNGIIKVGKSKNPEGRIKSHCERVSCLGVSLIEKYVATSVRASYLSERELIQFCAAAATNRIKSEWFEGLDFHLVCQQADEICQKPEPVIVKNKEPDDIQKGNRYIISWNEDGSYKWTDTQPLNVHWPDSEVMRWHMRPNDWFLIWPELIDHPCSILFAFNHPKRESVEPSFKEWVKSWPSTYRPVNSINTFILDMEKKGALTRQDLRPDDWHLIWPELTAKRAA